MIRVLRQRDWSKPVKPVAREVRSALPGDDRYPPLLFVGRPAEFFAEHWLDRCAERGWSAYTVTPRAGRLVGVREHCHDVVQVAASLPRQAVLVGHGPGARWAAAALTRYPARAAVLIDPPARLPDEDVVGPAQVLLVGAAGRALTKAGEHYKVTPTLLSDPRRLTDPSWLYPLEGLLDWLEQTIKPR
ncbi:hypothetical protein Lfu02_50900 [Longispora fulva]|uniref:Pimeloyl-ACP methyl ester carboxylesterase n=1 Tax=Longispora fulva TaxID=619741 RepID=A0A8J7H447_9ACTN|nr:alpha/beta hydrolase [Longispora fulva]MBG6141013.1 pimeloyl-ACP methyl ester carboxylesterase [Longispora fulva]GIG60718.1 hypothetical protein Lfu02_50900 [Longispora fulva]